MEVMDTEGLLNLGIGEIIVWSAVFAVLAVLAYLVYRSMEKPRLVLTPTPDGPRARRRDVILWAITTPLLVFFWWNFFFTVLWISDNDLNLTQLVLFPIAIIIAVRTLAFVVPPAAHELAKILPLTIIALIVLMGSVRDGDDMLRIAGEVNDLDLSIAAYVFLFAYEYAITAIWYWGWIRWGQPLWAARKARRSGAAAHPQPEGTP
jgi:hypothetical protein